MNDNDKFSEEIVFLESEIVDDDEDAPLGTLFNAATENASVDAQSGEDEAPASVETQAPVSVAQSDEASEAVAVQENGEAPTPLDTPADEAQNTPAISEAPAEAKEEAAPSIESESSIDDNSVSENAAPISEEKPAETDTIEDDSADNQAAAETQTVKAEEAQAEDDSTAPKAEIKINDDGFGSDLGKAWAVAEIKPAKKAAAKNDSKAKPEAAADKPAAKKVKAATTDKPEAAKVKKAAKPAENTEGKMDKTTAKTAADKKPAAAKKPADDAKAKAKPVKEEAAVKPKAAKADEVKKPVTKKEEAAETVIVEGDPTIPHGKYVIKKTDKGNFVYKLYSFNHRVVAIGAEQYSSLATCKGGINSVIKNAENAPIEDQTLKKWDEQKCPKWQVYADKKGEIRLRLIASNGNIVATTNDGYLSKDAAKKGIEAIARASKGSDIVRNDNLW